MADKEDFKQGLADRLEASRLNQGTFEKRIEHARGSPLEGIARVMMARHNLDDDTALSMVVECCDMRRPYFLRFLRGYISKDEWIAARDDVDRYVIAKYTGMLH